MFSLDNKNKLVPFSSNLNLESPGGNFSESTPPFSNFDFSRFPDFKEILQHFVDYVDELEDEFFDKYNEKLSLKNTSDFENFVEHLRGEYEDLMSKFLRNSDLLKSLSKMPHSDDNELKIIELRFKMGSLVKKAIDLKELDYMLDRKLKYFLDKAKYSAISKSALEEAEHKANLVMKVKEAEESSNISNKNLKKVLFGTGLAAVGSAAGYGIYKYMNKDNKNKKQESSPLDHPYQLGKSLIDHLQNEHRSRSI